MSKFLVLYRRIYKNMVLFSWSHWSLSISESFTIIENSYIPKLPRIVTFTYVSACTELLPYKHLPAF